MGAFPLATLERAGVPMILGSDAPIESADPWLDIASAVNRSDRSCCAQPWVKSERIVFPRAFHARTRAAADGNLLPRGWGTLDPGTHADLQILDALDPVSITCWQEASIFDMMCLGEWRLGNLERL